MHPLQIVLIVVSWVVIYFAGRWTGYNHGWQDMAEVKRQDSLPEVEEVKHE